MQSVQNTRLPRQQVLPMRTSSCRYAQVDVFTSKAGMGNPLGVVFDADGWSSARMQRLTVWLNLVETTFVLSPSRNDASYRLRIFTPSREIPFAGHPSIGSAHTALRLGFCTATGGQLRQECAAGLLPLRVESDPRQPLLSITNPPARIENDADPGPALALLAAYLQQCEPQGPLARGYIASQGRELGRDAWLHLCSDATATWVGDHCVLVLHGRLGWPDHDDDRGDAIR